MCMHKVGFGGKVEGSEGEVVNQECWVKSQTLPMLKHDG